MAPKKNNSSVPSKVLAKRGVGVGAGTAHAAGAKKADLSKLSELIDRRDMTGAQALIDSLMKKKLTEAEKARIHMDMLSTYLEVSNELNKHYLAELEDVVAFMKELKKEEKVVAEELSLAKVRAKLL